MSTNKQQLDEIWKDIVGYEDMYQISNYGNVRSLTRKSFNKQCGGEYAIKGRTIKTRMKDNGYIHVNLYRNGKPKTFSVHRLVATMFIPNENNYPIVNHKDENRANNKSTNLEWCDNSYNVKYGNSPQKISVAIKNKLSKPIQQIDKSGNIVAEYNSANEAARILGYEQAAIQRCCVGKINYSYGYKWKYK